MEFLQMMRNQFRFWLNHSMEYLSKKIKIIVFRLQNQTNLVVLLRIEIENQTMAFNQTTDTFRIGVCHPQKNCNKMLQLCRVHIHHMHFVCYAQISKNPIEIAHKFEFAIFFFVSYGFV